jgi:hypothetical protein
MTKVVIVQRYGYPVQAAFTVQQLAEAVHGENGEIISYTVRKYPDLESAVAGLSLDPRYKYLNFQVLDYDEISCNGLAG